MKYVPIFLYMKIYAYFHTIKNIFLDMKYAFSYMKYRKLYFHSLNLHSCVHIGYIVVQLLSHAWLCNPMDCNMLGFPVLHHLQELAQTHIHWTHVYMNIRCIQQSRPQIWAIHLIWASIPFLEPQQAVFMAGLWWDCSISGSSVHRILQARILEWVAISFSRGSSGPRDWTWASRTAGRLFTIWATREALAFH